MTANFREIMRIRTIAAVLLAAAFSRAVPPARPADISGAIGAFTDTIMQKYSIPGSMIGIWKNDSAMAFMTRGTADLAKGSPLRPGLQVRIGSITKTFTASVLLELADEKKLSLDDTLGAFLPGMPGGGRVTLRQLCSHTSGIHDVIEDTLSGCSFYKDPKRKPREDWLADCIGHSRLDTVPGTAFSYSNTNFVLLGMVVEKVTGRPLASEIRRRLLVPYKLAATAFPADSCFTSAFCRGYMPGTAGGTPQDVSFINPSLVAGAGAILSTVNDLRAWARILAEEPFLKPRTRQERLTFSRGWNEKLRYGLGIMKIGPFIGHSGGIFGYNTGMFYDPERKITVVVVLNGCNYREGHMIEVMLRIEQILDDVSWGRGK